MNPGQTRTNMGNPQNEVVKQSNSYTGGRNEMTPYDLMRIRDIHGKDGDRNIERILEEFREKNKKIKKIANMFVEKFVNKYGMSMPLHTILERANKYKKKYNLTDDEFAQVKRTFEEKLFSSNHQQNKVVQYNTNLARTLGNAYVETFDGIVVSNTEDYQHLQEIIKTYTLNRFVYQNIVFQTSTYTEQYNKLKEIKHDQRSPVYQYVHPIIVAFFVPKIRLIEERMLYSNLAGIIVARFNKTSISTKQDHELLYSLVNDPNDIVCSNSTPIVDLYNRCLVQLNLWRSVYDMRTGRFSSQSHIDALTAIDNCKINNNDNPDMLLLSDEGIILRRLFSTFSFRPIITMSVPISVNLLRNPYGFSQDQRIINTIPYITYRLPLIQKEGEVLKLESANIQNTYNLDVNTGRYYPNTSTIFNINGPLVYYIPRKFIDIPVPTTSILNISQLPIIPNQRLSVQAIQVEFETAYTHFDKLYQLKSSVGIHIKKSNLNVNNGNIIQGNETVIYDYVDSNTIRPHSIHVYIPQDILINDKSYFTQLDNINLEDKLTDMKTSTSIFIYNASN